MEYVIISGAFDGMEGNSLAMGAIVDSVTLSRCEKLHLDPTSFLNNNDSNNFFSQLGDTLVTGQTGTNVNDMTLIIIDKAEK
jgi:glycerate 2-kinase